MSYYSFNMKKGKYQIEMMSDDIYFATRQVDRLFEKLYQIKGRLRVVLPQIDPEEVIKEAKELEKTSLSKEIPLESLKTQEKTLVNPVMQEDKPVETVVAPKAVKEELPETIEQNIFSEEDETIIRTVDKIFEEELLVEENEETLYEKEKEVSEIVEEVAEEGIQGNLFENILAEKTQEIEESYEEEELQDKELSKTKKSFVFKNITTEKNENNENQDSQGVYSRQKAGFKTSKIEEPEIKRVTPQDVVFEEDEEIVQILEEKIKKSLPQQKNKTISVEEQEITAVEIIEPDLAYEEESDATDVTTQEFESLGELIAIKNPQSKLDYLLLTAYYLQMNESLFKYSLKQLNSKAMPFLGSLIDHSVIHNAVAHDFIEVVPDYNGTVEVTEYRLTSLGENYLINEL